MEFGGEALGEGEVLENLFGKGSHARADFDQMFGAVGSYGLCGPSGDGFGWSCGELGGGGEIATRADGADIFRVVATLRVMKAPLHELLERFVWHA